MSDIDVKVTMNVGSAIQELRRWMRDAESFIASQIETELSVVLEDIKANYVPIDTGALRDTGRVDPVKISGHNLTSGISFGGEGVDYALIQHEDLTYHHPHGQAKYIEVPLRNWVESKK